MISGKRKADEEAEPFTKKAKVESQAAAFGADSDKNPPSLTLWVGNLSCPYFSRETSAAPCRHAHARPLCLFFLPGNVDQDWLKSEFESCGEIVGTRIQMDRETGRSRGIGQPPSSPWSSRSQELTLASVPRLRRVRRPGVRHQGLQPYRQGDRRPRVPHRLRDRPRAPGRLAEEALPVGPTGQPARHHPLGRQPLSTLR